MNYICRHLGGLIHSRYAMRCKIEGGAIDKVDLMLSLIDKFYVHSGMDCVLLYRYFT